MRLTTVRIQNFRAFKDITLPVNAYTCLVGPNGAGKSTVLTALNVFFRNTDGAATGVTELQEEDFHNKDTSAPIAITLTFDQLSDEAQQDFAAYYRSGVLTVSATAEWDSESGSAKVFQHGERLVMGAFAPYFAKEKDGEKVAELRTFYQELREKYTDLPDVTTKGDMANALRAYEESHPDECESRRSSDEFYGISKGKNLLEKYIQWVYVPAVKDATSEEMEAKNTVLGRLLQRTVRSKVSFDDPVAALIEESRGKYQAILDGNQSALDSISSSLSERLREWAHPEARLRLEWFSDPASSVKIADPAARIVAGEGSFDGMLARLGHGLQRSFLLAILQELSYSDDKDAPRLILGCEEPELYQHPPQARHLAGVFTRLSEQNSQIMVCTHSPYFVSGRGFEQIRLFRKNPVTSAATAYHVSLADIAADLAGARGEAVPSATATEMKVEQALRSALNEMFFTPVLVLVEGLEDVAYLRAWFSLSGRDEEFRKLGCHIVPTDGKSYMLYPVAIARRLGIPAFVICDSDADTSNPQARTMHEKDNKTILSLCGYPDESPMPTDNLWKPDLVMWKSNLGREVTEDFGAADCQTLRDEVRTERGLYVKGLSKNSMFIGEVLAKGWDQGKRSPLLDKLCESILTFARTKREEI
jgi:predicted ATP-dependent endonuclease of OLD family